MGRIVRRDDDDATPVQARRAAGARADQISDEISAGEPMPNIPPPRPGSTQNIIYVVAPAASNQPPAGLTPPQEIHYHTTNNYQPIKRRREKGSSFFGWLAVMTGLLACACAYAPPLGRYVKPIAEAGLAMGAFAFLISTLFRRSGRGIPAIGILISAIAFPIWLTRTGQLQPSYDQLRSRSPIPLPAIDFGTKPAANPATPTVHENRSTASPAPQAAQATPSQPEAVVPHLPKDHSIFGDKNAWQKPDDVVVPKGKPNAAGNETGSASPKSVAAPLSNDAATASLSLAAATVNLENARLNAARRLGVDYTTAKDAAAAATAADEQAKIQYPQSPELIDADQKKLAATSELRAIESRLDNDPEVAAAEQAVRQARR